MNKDTQRAWVNEALDEVLEALACRTSISGILVFKGARVLNRRLESTPRQSYDIDSNLSEAFVRQFPSRAAQQQYIQDITFRDAWSALVSVVRYFERSGLVPFRFPLP